MMKGKGWMRKLKKILFSPAGTIGMFVLAMILLFSSSVGGAQAALTYYSETYTSRIQMYDIGVTLLENEAPISWRNYGSREDDVWGGLTGDGTWEENTGELLAHMLDVEGSEEKAPLQLGVTYPERLKVSNSGTINEYVRVSVYKYWMVKKTAEDGTVTYEKVEHSQDLSPDLIDLHFLYNGCDGDQGYRNGWILDTKASTEERTVLYCDHLLYAAEQAGEGRPQESELFTDTLTIKGAVADRVEQKVTKEGKYTVIETTYQYDDVKFQIEARVDAVQEHNAQDAAWSAWGRRIQVQDGALSLAD